MLRIGLLLCGCGSLDGSDPLQTVALRIAIARSGDLLFPLAPDRDQADVIGLQGALTDHRRNALAEATRLTGGHIDALESILPDELDVLAVVGGLGVLKTLGDAPTPAGSTLLRGVLARRGALLLFDEGVVWAARSHAPQSNHGWRLATGTDRRIRTEIESSGHQAAPLTSQWVEDAHDPVFSIVLDGEARADHVLDACVQGLHRVRQRLRALDGFTDPEDPSPRHPTRA